MGSSYINAADVQSKAYHCHEGFLFPLINFLAVLFLIFTVIVYIRLLCHVFILMLNTCSKVTCSVSEFSYVLVYNMRFCGNTHSIWNLSSPKGYLWSKYGGPQKLKPLKVVKLQIFILLLLLLLFGSVSTHVSQ